MFKFNRIFFIISNFVIAFLSFFGIYYLRYMGNFFIDIPFREISTKTIIMLLFYSLIIIVFNISFKVYELNKISRIKESIIYNIITSFFSIGFLSFYFYLTATEFARFVFFTGFVAIPLLISFFNKIIFSLVFPSKIIKVTFLGEKNKLKILEGLFEKYSDLLKFEVKFIDILSNFSKIEEELLSKKTLIIDGDYNYNDNLFNLLHLFEVNGNKIYTLADVFSYLDQSLPAEIISKNAHFELFSSYKIYSTYTKVIKRAGDIFISIFLLTLLLPVIIFVGVLIKLTSRGGVFYNQKRVGLKGHEFTMFKFRTMVENAESGKAKLAIVNDKRVTFVGRFLRMTRLDELPQLINILKGDMSFIGPRPERKELIEEIIKIHPLFQKRLLVKPGLTGWAQVKHSYVNNLSEMDKKLGYDLFYINNISLLFDLKIMLYTIETVLFKRGAI